MLIPSTHFSNLKSYLEIQVSLAQNAFSNEKKKICFTNVTVEKHTFSQTF